MSDRPAVLDTGGLWRQDREACARLADELAEAHMTIAGLRGQIVALEAEIDLINNALGPARLVAAGGYPHEAVRDLVAEADRLRGETTRIARRVTDAHHSLCTCGGAGPGEGCDVCEMYHAIMRTQRRTPTGRTD